MRCYTFLLSFGHLPSRYWNAQSEDYLFFSSNIYSDLQELEYLFMLFLIFESLLVILLIVEVSGRKQKNRKVLNMIIGPPKKNTRC
jgi:hypothetical protein